MIAFDIDDTLIHEDYSPRWPVVDLLRSLHALGFPILVWSGGGRDYAAQIGRRLGLDEFVTEYDAKGPRNDVVLAFDDRPAEALAPLVLQVPAAAARLRGEEAEEIDVYGPAADWDLDTWDPADA